MGRTASAPIGPDTKRVRPPHPSLRGIRGACKRGTDVLGAAILLVLLAPAFLLIALLVKLGSKGPVFYGQERMGLRGDRFILWKFRTMVHGAEKRSGPVMATRDDARCTPFGRWLRRFSLDEVPQLWNVLQGEMSLVGPRPERPFFACRFERDLPGWDERLHVKPGMTGWAQVNGARGNGEFARRLELDLAYLRAWSLAFDLAILFRTPFCLRGPNAY